jgi:hypothetical protein
VGGMRSLVWYCKYSSKKFRVRSGKLCDHNDYEVQLCDWDFHRESSQKMRAPAKDEHKK